MHGNRLDVGQRAVGPSFPALVVAEIGQNHNGQLHLAEQLVDAASWAGADAVKFVKRDLQCELSREARRWRYSSPHAFGETYAEHRQALELSAEDHASLCRRARQRGLLYFATPCDEPSLRLVQSLGTDALKIASRDVSNLPLVDAVARAGVPVLLSTGMSPLSEVDEAVAVLDAHDARFAVLQCTSLYPTPYEEAHLNSLETLHLRYARTVGFSDHTAGTLLAPVAVALGASIVEKHLTLDRKLKGSDHACSLEPGDFFQMVTSVRQVESAMGQGGKPVPAKVAAVRTRLGRSLVARRDLRRGVRLDENMLSLKCPGDGIAWQERARVVGKKLRHDVAADEKLRDDDFE